MKAVIMVAGRGKRLKDFTRDIPKPLIPVAGKPIVEYTLDALPVEIDEVIFVVGHLGEKIKNHFKEQYEDIKISYVEQIEIKGTMDALMTARGALSDGAFLVLNGDDIYSASDIKKFIGMAPAMGIFYGPTDRKSISIETDRDGIITGSHVTSAEERRAGVATAAGIYILDSRIFDYKPEELPGGETGLPQTVLSFAKNNPVKAIEVDLWLPVNTPEELARAESFLKENKNTPN